MVSISEKYKDLILQLVQNSQKQHTVDETNVYQTGNLTNRKLIGRIMDDLVLPESRLEGAEHLLELAQLSKAGKSCLILSEHYSNFDLPVLFHLLEKLGADGAAAAETLIAIAGFKLNQENPVVLAFAEAFSRIVIYPSRSLAALKDPALLEAETKKSNAINLAAMKALTRAKYHGHLILVYPAGTRYRPGVPETKRGVKEIDSYLKSFEHVVLVSINGSTLVINPAGSMHEDLARQDVMIMKCSPVLSAAEFRKAAQESCPEGQDPKQFTVDQVMARLEELHAEAEPLRRAALDARGLSHD